MSVEHFEFNVGSVVHQAGKTVDLGIVHRVFGDNGEAVRARRSRLVRQHKITGHFGGMTRFSDTVLESSLVEAVVFSTPSPKVI